MNTAKFTKKLLAQSFAQLAREKQIDDITVNDIVELCGISRTTFYRHFADKYELMNWIFDQYIESLTYRYSHISCYKALMFDIATFFGENRELFLRMLDYNGQNSFKEYFLAKTAEYVSTMLKRIQKKDHLTLNEEYMVIFNSNGVLNTLHCWLLSGCKESPKDIAQILIDSMPQSIREYFLPFYHNDVWEMPILPDDWDWSHRPSDISFK